MANAKTLPQVKLGPYRGKRFYAQDTKTGSYWYERGDERGDDPERAIVSAAEIIRVVKIVAKRTGHAFDIIQETKEFGAALYGIVAADKKTGRAYFRRFS